MQEKDKEVIVDDVQCTLDGIKSLTALKIDDSCYDAYEAMETSLERVMDLTKKESCPFDSTLGDALDLLVFACNENDITSKTDNFSNLIEKHIKNVKNVNAKDKAFMSAKKISTHLKNFDNTIPKSNSKLSPSVMLAKLKIAVRKKDQDKLKELSKEMLISKSHRYIGVVRDLLKLEKYRLTEKLVVKDSEISYSNNFTSGQVGMTTGSNWNWESIIKTITSDAFAPQEKDIKQGMIGDCYLLSALKSIVRSDPKIIKKCFVANKEDGIILRFFKVVVTTKREGGGKAKLETKAAGRVMIKMDKSVLLNLSSRTVFGNSQTYMSSIWVNLIEKGYGIYVAKNNIIDKDLNYEKMDGHPIKKMVENPDKNLAAMEGGLSVIPTTAITGKKGTGFITDFSGQQAAGGNIPGNFNSQSQQTGNPVKGPVDPSTIIEIIKEEIGNGKAMTATTKPASFPCWKNMMMLNGSMMSDIIANYVLCSHVYSVKGIEKIGRFDYIVLSDPHMSANGVIITGNQINTNYGGTGDVRLTAQDFGQYFGSYYVSKLKSSKK